VLFDLGYVTVTPNLRLEVGRRLKAEWENGKEHRHGRRLDSENNGNVCAEAGARPKVSTRSKIGKQISDPRRMTMQMFAYLYNFVHSALDEESHLDGEQQGGFERLSS
jgi:hypothetical protein